MKKPIAVTFAHALSFHNFISIFTELALNPGRLNLVKVIKPGISLYTLVVRSCCLNDRVILACISEVQANSKIKKALLFSTDIHLPPEQIVEDDRARFIR